MLSEMPSLRRFHLGLLLATVLGLASLLGACGDRSGDTSAASSASVMEPTDAEVLAAEALRPSRPELAVLYERSCMVCHGVRSAAPLTGHAAAWQPRLAQGMDTLLKHTREGVRGMPAMGLCPDCSEPDLRELITFMSTPR